jgi:hypothetical protein
MPRIIGLPGNKIEGINNTRCRHSSLGYLRHKEFEDVWYTMIIAVHFIWGGAQCDPAYILALVSTLS